jgi:hypothetical protein
MYLTRILSNFLCLAHLGQRSLWDILFQSFSLKSLEQKEQNVVMAKMLLDGPQHFFVIFISFGKPAWLLG